MVSMMIRIVALIRLLALPLIATAVRWIAMVMVFMITKTNVRIHRLVPALTKTVCQYVIKETVSVELEVLFDLNKAVVKPAFYEEIKNVGEF